MRQSAAAGAYVIFFLCSAFFQLVFTFNPTSVNVLMHSVPFMVFQVGIGIFLYSEVFALYLDEKISMASLVRKYPTFILFSGFMVMLNIGSVLFMAMKMMTNPKIALNQVNLVGHEIGHWEPETLRQKVELVISTILAGIQEPLFFFWFWISPRAKTCVAMDITVERSEDVDSPAQVLAHELPEGAGKHMPNDQTAKGHLDFKIRLKRILLGGIRFMLLFAVLDVTFNETSNKHSSYELCINGKVDLGSFPVASPDECNQACQTDNNCIDFEARKWASDRLPAECTKFKACNGTATTKEEAKKEKFMHDWELSKYTDQHWRSVVKTLPGVAIFAVGWVVVLVWMTSYCFLEIYCTWNDPEMNAGLKSFLILACSLMAFSGYLAHGGTIPKVAEKYPKYPGPGLLGLSFCLLIVAKSLVTCSQRTVRKPTHVVVELSAAAATLLSLFAGGISDRLSGLIVGLVSIIIWANLLCTKTVMSFTSWELVPDLGNKGPWPPCWELLALRGPDPTLIGMKVPESNGLE